MMKQYISRIQNKQGQTLVAQKQKGATLLELTMAIGIIAVIAIAAISFFNNAADSQKSLEASSNVSALTASIRNQFAGQGNYVGINNETARLGNAFPRKMEGPTPTDIKHPWSDTGVAVAEENILFAGDAFSITLTDVPLGACVDVAAKIFGEFESVSINGTAVADVAAVATECAAGGAANELAFVSR